MTHSEDARVRHRRAWEAIPWRVNGRIDDAERAVLEAHLRECRDCRDELALQERVRDELARQPGPAADIDASLARLWQRIDAQDAMRPAADPARTWVRWLAAAVIVESVALAALIGANVGGAAPEYRTFSTPPAAGAPAIRAVFAADLPLGELQALLERAHLQIVAGPTGLGVYTLAPRPEGHHEAALDLLRADARVRFAEPIAGAPGP